MDDETREEAWSRLLDLIDRYAYGPGEAGLAHLEDAGEAPPVVSAAEVRRLARMYGFDLPSAVKSLRDGLAKFERDRL